MFRENGQAPISERHCRLFLGKETDVYELSDMDVRAVVETIHDRIPAGTNRFQYGNALIEGSDEPMHPDGYALYFPSVEPGMPRYRLVMLDDTTDENFEKCEKWRNNCRRRILEARVPEHKRQLEQHLLALYNSYDASQQDEVLDELGSEALRENLPPFFAIFGKTIREQKPVFVIMYPPALPLIVCLELLQISIRDAMELHPS